MLILGYVDMFLIISQLDDIWTIMIYISMWLQAWQDCTIRIFLKFHSI